MSTGHDDETISGAITRNSTLRMNEHSAGSLEIEYTCQLKTPVNRFFPSEVKIMCCPNGKIIANYLKTILERESLSLEVSRVTSKSANLFLLFNRSVCSHRD